MFLSHHYLIFFLFFQLERTQLIVGNVIHGLPFEELVLPGQLEAVKATSANLFLTQGEKKTVVDALPAPSVSSASLLPSYYFFYFILFSKVILLFFCKINGVSKFYSVFLDRFP